MAEMITKENFGEVVMQSEKPVLVDFWAPWCGPCKALSPVIEELSADVGETAVIGKVNVDEQPELARQFRVMSIPTVLVFKEGKPVFTSIGVKSKDALASLIEKAV